MNLYVSNYLDERIKEITQNLLKSNGKYYLAIKKSKELHKNVNSIINREEEITISAGDCIDFKKLFEHKFESASIVQKELYKQGYLDCIKVLKMLGVIDQKVI